jgi:DnaJ-class molecular chaperone
MPVEKILTINIKPGWKAGTKIKFHGEGDDLPSGQTQDIEFFVEEITHTRFKRDADNLRTTLDLSLVEALTGFQHVITTLDGRNLKVIVDTFSDKLNDRFQIKQWFHHHKNCALTARACQIPKLALKAI